MRSLILIRIPYVILCKILIKNLLNTRQTLYIDEIPNFDYAEAYLGDLKSSPNWDEFGKVGLGEEF